MNAGTAPRDLMYASASASSSLVRTPGLIMDRMRVITSATIRQLSLINDISAGDLTDTLGMWVSYRRRPLIFPDFMNPS